MEEGDERSPLMYHGNVEVRDKYSSNGTGVLETGRDYYHPQTGNAEITGGDVERPKYKARWPITVEPYLFLYCFSLFGVVPLQIQYIYLKVAEEMGYVPASNSTSSSQSPCADVNKSSPDYILQQQVQAESSNWSMYFSICSTITSVFVTIFYGAHSDKGGRRLSLLLPTVGGLIKLGGYVIAIYFKWPLWALLPMSFIEGLFGQYATALMAAFAYLADVCTSKNKAIRILIAEAALGIAAAISNVSVGILIKAFPTFVEPAAMLAGIMLLALLYTIAFLPELGEKDPSAKLIDCSNALKVGKLFLHGADDKDTGRVWKLRLLLLVFLFCAIPVISAGSLDILYVMNSPFCWDSVRIGYYNSIKFIGYEVCAVAGLFAMRRWLKLSEVTVVMVSCISALGARIMLALAQTDTLIYIETAVGCLFMLAVPMLRTVLSKLATNQEQGALFASISFMENAGGLIGSVVLSSIYAGTVAWFRGFVQMVIGGLYLLSLILLGYLVY
ncbi:solute carrier family 46 member 3 isoform X2 [Lingula anatina]|uniref:Solute carrier family 46 member 3 isoform X2 n=1 Tax=Lingula anatina TaxID=7574 RepID=A0A1S3J304_LINAN|nr:solute carrier family 46 member 3 isoform X2 [Lingula anatina]|eukprot:XP_013404790.1 solute carrier family 46 member 3 isoform X2 [Lingula anatina]